MVDGQLPAGWYDNGDGERRYFDGETWRTGFTEPAKPSPPAVAGRQPRASGVRWGRVALLAAVVGLSAWACSAIGGNSDPSGDQACIEWTGVVVEGTSGVLTDDEIRVRLQDVYDNSVGSPDLEQPATDLLAGATGGTIDENAASMMTAACNART
jgi:hypothetical protein